MPVRHSRFNVLLGILLAVSAVLGVLALGALMWALYGIAVHSGSFALLIKRGFALVLGSGSYWAWSIARSAKAATDEREHAHLRRPY